MADIRVHQIFYSDATRAKLDPGFVPLDNTANARPDWFEFWPIRNFLNATELDPDAWYGFVSPNFKAKTGLNAAYVHKVVTAVDAKADVALFTPGWDQLAYFRSVFEQGDLWHPGLIEATRAFLETVGIALDLEAMVTHSLSSVFSNYVVARPAYWREWLALANRFFDYVEGEGAEVLASGTTYGNRIAPMKTFVQERLSAVVMALGTFRVIAYDPSEIGPIAPMFADHGQTRMLLQQCDRMKQLYVARRDAAYLESYRRARERIPLGFRIPGLNAPR